MHGRLPVYPERRWNRVGKNYIILHIFLEVTQKHMAPSFIVSFEKGGMAGVVTLNFAD